MREWNFSPDKPFSLSLACDARLSPTDYTNDQIWELNLGGSEPPAISLQTNFGLRARSCRIFPRFGLNSHTLYNPAQFHHPVIIHQYFANYIRLSCKPFSSFNVVIEYWVPTSQSIACRTKIINTSREENNIDLSWAEVLVPTEDGSRMSTCEVDLATILSGQTANLVPVLFLTGGATHGKSPYPSLDLSITLAPRSEQEFLWVHASLADINSSYTLAKSLVGKNWDTEFARISRVNSQRMEIFTGSPQWDNIFHIEQTLVEQLFLSATPACSSGSFVSSRSPDQGYSLLPDGSDYSHLWNGLSALDALYLVNFLLPAAPGLVKSLLDSFLAALNAQGEIDLKPGLGGQRSQLLATPVLANIARLYYEYTGNIEYIQKILPGLITFFFSWFSNRHDRDGDLIPEWDQPVQSGFEDHPLFSFSSDQASGLDISSVESPGLSSYLFNECQSLLSLAETASNQEVIPRLSNIAERLLNMLEQSWDDNQACFLYRDRDSHLSSSTQPIGQLEGAGVLEVHRDFGAPIRPVLIIRCKREGTRPLQIYIHGTSTSGAHRVDHIPGDQIHWHLNTGFVTSPSCYLSIEHLEISGLLPEDQLFAQTADLTHLDYTLLMPLWARAVSESKAKIMTNLTIMNKKRFLCSYGLRPCSNDQQSDEISVEYTTISFPWISQVLDGLVKYGEQKKAAEIYSRLMKAVASSFEKDLALHQHYHSETGKPFGPKNTLTSLMPIGSFLEILGVKVISPTLVEITGTNPFPWPVTIKYRGLTVVQQEKKALIIFSDGQSVTVDNSQPHLVRNSANA